MRIFSRDVAKRYFRLADLLKAQLLINRATLDSEDLQDLLENEIDTLRACAQQLMDMKDFFVSEYDVSHSCSTSADTLTRINDRFSASIVGEASELPDDNQRLVKMCEAWLDTEAPAYPVGLIQLTLMYLQGKRLP